MKYAPFKGKLHMLACALEDAIAWEQSRIDAGICTLDGGDDGTEARIVAYRKYLKEILPNYKTSNERMNEMLEGCESLTLEQIRKRSKG